MTKEEQDLISILKEEILIYQGFLEIKEKEREAVLSFSTGNLEKLNSIQDELARRAHTLENDRRKVVRKILKTPENEEDPKLSDLLRSDLLQNRQEIAGLGARLRQLCEEVAKEQDISAHVIGTSAGYLRELVDGLIRRLQPDAVAYNLDGTKSLGRETSPTLLDQKL